jgi:FAD/FMN-containing dehydrogenase
MSQEVIDPQRRPDAKWFEGGRAIPVASGCAYSDVGLSSGGVGLSTKRLTRFAAASWSTGVVRVEAGMTLAELERVALAKGWFPPVVPGTGRVTIGGAVAGDVHGKNHHAHGAFGDHVLAIWLFRSDHRCEVRVERGLPLFHATVGGLGLTGLITKVELQLKRAPGQLMESDHVPFSNIQDYFALDAASSDWEFRVAWVDCGTGSGPGIFTRSNWSPHDRPRRAAQALTLPGPLPFSVVGPASSWAFNRFYLAAGRARGRRLERCDQVLHPLDGVAGWNGLYGRSGFRQYQCVVPPQSRAAIGEIVESIAKSGLASPLTVLKTFGERNPSGLLSFCRPGVTLAVDFPNLNESVDRLFSRLDDIVEAAGGALYPSKDARIPERLLWAGFPDLSAFKAFRDPGLSSDFSRRYGL